VTTFFTDLRREEIILKKGGRKEKKFEKGRRIEGIYGTLITVSH